MGLGTDPMTRFPVDRPAQELGFHAADSSRSLQDLLGLVRIVLVEPESGGNIGASARALKTMGLCELVLVSPQCNPTGPEARRLAHNAEDILGEATVVSSLDQALVGTVFSVATTGRRRSGGLESQPPPAAAEQMLCYAARGPVGLVFGRESRGLTNTELARCSLTSTVPAATDVPSLNLAQAVMVYCYELYRSANTQQVPLPVLQPATDQQKEQFYDHLGRTLVALGVRPAVSLDRLVDKYRRVLNRASLEHRDLLLLHKLLESADRYVEENPTAKPG